MMRNNKIVFDFSNYEYWLIFKNINLTNKERKYIELKLNDKYDENILIELNMTNMEFSKMIRKLSMKVGKYIYKIRKKNL